MISLSPQELKAKQESGSFFTLVDLQDADAYAHRHIPGAVHMEPSSTCNEDCARLLKDKDAEIVLYGAFDELGKGALVAEVLEKAGYSNVFRLSGGFMGWMEAGFSVEHGVES